MVLALRGLVCGERGSESQHLPRIFGVLARPLETFDLQCLSHLLMCIVTVQPRFKAAALVSVQHRLYDPKAIALCKQLILRIYTEHVLTWLSFPMASPDMAKNASGAEPSDITTQENVSSKAQPNRQSNRPQVRHRASVACASCRDRRIRCVVPQGQAKCNQCRRTGIDCVIKNDDERRR
jgi:hypothetical protein